MARYYARSASDRTDNWLYWFVADQKLGGINRTAECKDALNIPRAPGSVLGEAWDMVKLAMRANRELPE